MLKKHDSIQELWPQVFNFQVRETHPHVQHGWNTYKRGEVLRQSTHTHHVIIQVAWGISLFVMIQLLEMEQWTFAERIYLTRPMGHTTQRCVTSQVCVGSVGTYMSSLNRSGKQRDRRPTKLNISLFYREYLLFHGVLT